MLAARAVSVTAGVATLLLLLQWGARAHSRTAGLIAAAMLATSLQFMVSTHWVLIDPLLMLATTAAAWAAWELLARHDSAHARLGLYLALVLALWIKGLIGPALIGAGLLAYVGDRSAGGLAAAAAVVRRSRCCAPRCCCWRSRSCDRVGARRCGNGRT